MNEKLRDETEIDSARNILLCLMILACLIKDYLTYHENYGTL